jgi:hypothetical protein
LLVAASDSVADKVDSATDKVVAMTYLDAGTCDERVDTITVSSASLGISYTDTIAYASTNGIYRATGVTRVESP